jgi:flagellar biosynthesis protein FlhA
MANVSTGTMKGQSFLKNKDILLSFVVLLSIALIMIPLPTGVLDIALSMNLTISIIIILITMYTPESLDFSIFPSLLLITTIFRLALNVSSTRLILLNGTQGTSAAGQVIQAFGEFVVGGNYVVGAVIFTILVIINIKVITAGSTRISEVAARFTLDAMPGKQMSIDADLNAGLITEEEARERRERIRREADFFGAMDGATKFVSGDAKAGLLITLINILGGFAIGALKGMPMLEALKTYTILTIGDGLVSQVPAITISLATGILVSRAASKESLGGEIASQIFGYPKALSIASVTLTFFSLIPGLPKLPFMILALIAGSAAYFADKAKEKEKVIEEEKKEKERELAKPEAVETLPPLDLIEIEVGYGLIPLVDARQNGDLIERIKSLRKQFALDMGFVIPSIRIRDNLELKANEYAILIKGNIIAKSEIMINHFLAMNPGTVEEEIPGIKTIEPAFGLPALWIKDDMKEKAQVAGYTVVDIPTVIITHLTEVLKDNCYELLTREETQKIIDSAKTHYPKLIEELVPNILSVGQIQKVLQNLLREQVPIRDLQTIFEALADYGIITKEIDILTEYVRQGLYRTITKMFVGEDNILRVATISPQIEDAISNSIQRTEHGAFLTIDPQIANKLVQGVNQIADKFTLLGQPIVILTAPIVRYHLRTLLEKYIKRVNVLSHNEVAQTVNVESIGTIE